MSEELTNKQFSSTEEFRKCCTLANTIPTTRQASKFRNKHGKAWFIGKPLFSRQEEQEEQQTNA